MSNGFCPYENAVFETVCCFDEYVPEGREGAELWFAGGKLLAEGDCGTFLFLVGRPLAVEVLKHIRSWCDEERCKMLEKAIARGASLYDRQGTAGFSELRTAACTALRDKEADAWMRKEAALIIGTLVAQCTTAEA